MNTLFIHIGTAINTDDGYLIITARHFSDYAADFFRIGDDGMSTFDSRAILTASDILSYYRNATGKAYNNVIFQD